jgi:hypothetical protein
MSDFYPVAVAPGWSANYRFSPISFGIRFFSRPRANPFRLAEVNHMFLVWTMSDGRTTYREVHEALMSKGWCRQPFSKVWDWGQEKGHLVLVGASFTSLHSKYLAEAYAESDNWIGKRKSYATKQIGKIMVARTFLGRAARLERMILKDEDATVMCSEGASRIMWMLRLALADFRSCDDQPFDRITPQDALDCWRKRGLSVDRV